MYVHVVMTDLWSGEMKSQVSAVCSPQETYDYLTRALQLLEAPRYNTKMEVIANNSWVQNTLAIQADGVHCDPRSDLAVAYCTLGAIQAVTPDDRIATYVNSIIDMANPSIVASGSIPNVNDHARSFERVQRLFHRAQELVTKWI